MATRTTLPPFQDFLEANRATVYRFLTVAVGPQDADDAFQETFIAALRAYPRVREPDKLDRWILAIASRTAIDHHRGAGRRPVPTDEPPERPVHDPVPADADDPLWRAVRALPARQRVAVVATVNGSVETWRYRNFLYGKLNTPKLTVSNLGSLVNSPGGTAGPSTGEAQLQLLTDGSDLPIGTLVLELFEGIVVSIRIEL